MKAMFAVLLLTTMPAWCQARHGEIRLQVIGPAGAVVQASVELKCSANGYDKKLASDETGRIAAPNLPYGVYRVEVQEAGFARYASTIEVRSEVPRHVTIALSLEAVRTQVHVTPSNTNIDPGSPSSRMEMGSKEIEQRLASLPGRSVQDLVNSEPGWLYEGNAVLHPRGAEYQTQFVVDGIPLTDNRSPGFGPEIEADDLASISIYTAGYPAEYGRKMGGVVELNTRRQIDPGLHGSVVLTGGSYATASGYGQLQEVAGRNTFGISSAGSRSDHYLNPVVPENYTNTGTTGDFTGRYEREVTAIDRLDFTVRHELSRYLIPNEQVQEQAGQVQNGDALETMGAVRYQRILSPDSLVALAGMVRDNANDLDSNRNPTPIAAFEHNTFREEYFKGTYSLHHGAHEFKAGVEADAAQLHEQFVYTLTDASQFESNTPSSLAFRAAHDDLEQSAFVEDVLRLGGWTLSAGLRWDHYQLLLNQNAFSPRLSLGRSLPALRMVVHASYDHVFQTPSFENILISSSPEVEALSDEFLRLPVQPSRGNYYEGGFTEDLANEVRLDVNVYRRDVRNYADDDQLLNTGVSYPVAFNKSVVYGAEGKLALVHLYRLSGFLSYSYMVGNVWLPVTGGLFLGGDAANAASQLRGHFPDSQDQRNTLRTRFQYQLSEKVWLAGGAAYGSGLPFAYDGDRSTALADYGMQVIDRIDFARGRVRPQLATNASFGVDLYRRDKATLSLQADGDNLNDRLNVIDFGGLFSGNAIGPARTFAFRLRTSF